MMVEGSHSSLQRRMLAVLANTSSHDVRFEVEELDGTRMHVSAHRMIMAELSQPFSALLRSEFIEMSSPSIFLSDMSYDSLCNLVHYAYTGEIKVLVDQEEEAAAQSCLELLCIADKWQITDLGDVCEKEFLTHHLSTSNTADALNLACTLRQTHPDLLSNVLHFSCSFLLDLIEDGSLTRLNEDALREVLSANRMYIRQEVRSIKVLFRPVRFQITNCIAATDLQETCNARINRTDLEIMCTSMRS